jgi:hypothetical protein
MFLDGPVRLGPDWTGYDYMAECLRSTLPLIERVGIATAQEVDVDTVAERLREEVVSQHSYVVFTLMVGAWIHQA